MRHTARAATASGIERVVGQIVAGWRPEKIILFGSHAYGIPDENSDVDLLVIMKTPERLLRVAAEIAAGIDHPFPLDIVVRTPDEVAACVRAGDSFIGTVMARGTVLYEAGNAGLGHEGGR